MLRRIAARREKEMSDNGRGEFWAFMAGLLAGGVAALLYAPAKGEDTRKKIRETAEDAYHKGEEYYEKGITEAEKIYNDGRMKAEKIYSDGKHKVEEVVDAVQGKKAPKAAPKAE
ncbi:MAG TPA: YtxH domain-containing protein [Candidatus Sabulitectum sp.]|nr:YtxH domain-containing protein [Candidatus Sabulitectum sp.]HPJ28118.1 YtxH domain-containing protein [Candidatus Sabulitectum sp.]